MNENRLTKLFKNLKLTIQADNIKASLIKGGFWSLIINVISKILIFVIGILMIRILGRQQYGIYSYFFSLISISIIPVEYGISNLIIRETARAESNDQANTIIGLWWWSFRITLWVSLSLIGIILIILYSTGKSWVDEYQLFTLLWGLPLILIQSMIHLSSAALRGMKRIILGQVPNIIIIPLLFIVFFVLGSIIWPNDLSPAFAMAIRLFASIIALIASIIKKKKKNNPI